MEYLKYILHKLLTINFMENQSLHIVGIQYTLPRRVEIKDGVLTSKQVK